MLRHVLLLAESIYDNIFIFIFNSNHLIQSLTIANKDITRDKAEKCWRVIRSVICSPSLLPTGQALNQRLVMQLAEWLSKRLTAVSRFRVCSTLTAAEPVEMSYVSDICLCRHFIHAGQLMYSSPLSFWSV